MKRLAVALVIAAACSSCLLHDVDKQPKAPVAPPSKFENSTASENGAATKTRGGDGRWWRHFGDEELASLIEQALANNLDLKRAWARLEQAESFRRAATASLFPTVDASLQAGRSKSGPITMDLGMGDQTIKGRASNSFSASLPVSYELDVWGRVRAGVFAAEQDATAVRADVEAASMTIAANITERYLDVIEQRVLAALLEKQIVTNQQMLGLLELRFTTSEAALSDLYQQEQLIIAARAQLALIRGREQVADRQIAVLLGKPPQATVAAQTIRLPEPIPLPANGIPADLLQQRPDLRAAQRRVVAADYRVAQALAARFPTLGLSGSVGFSAPDLGNFFDSLVWNFMGNVTAPLWDGGRRSAEHARTKAVVDESLNAYGQALLNALLEVESILILERQQREYIAQLQTQVTTAQRTVRAAERRFSAGVTPSFLPTLTALRSLQQVEQSLLSAKRQLLSQRVQLYRALGGSWTEQVRDPTRMDPKDLDETRKRDEKAKAKPSKERDS
jgi:NodT family efflux transporter outer membrane factor (OMF) lipoprotein